MSVGVRVRNSDHTWNFSWERGDKDMKQVMDNKKYADHQMVGPSEGKEYWSWDNGNEIESRCEVGGWRVEVPGIGILEGWRCPSY